MERDFRPRGFAAPVKVGDEFDVKIEAVGEKGDGIAKKDGFVLFVPNAKEGDEVKIKVTRVLRRVGFAEIVGNGSSSPSENSQSGDSGSDASEEQESTEDTENFGEDS